MNKLQQWWWLALCGVLASCAAVRPLESASRSCVEAPKAAPFEQLCAIPQSLLVLCGQQHCGVYVCRDVVEDLTTGQVVLTKGGAAALPGIGLGAQRYWGSAQGLTRAKEPVFIIPWDAGPRELNPEQKLLLAQAEEKRKKPHEQHHIYPQAFRQWFTSKGINIDEFTLLLEVSEHRRIHRGPNGGPWNEEWRIFIENNRDATQEEIHLHAGKLIFEFGLLGVVIPYSR